jgi:hypothetical protein
VKYSELLRQEEAIMDLCRREGATMHVGELHYHWRIELGNVAFENYLLEMQDASIE